MKVGDYMLIKKEGSNGKARWHTESERTDRKPYKKLSE